MAKLYELNRNLPILSILNMFKPMVDDDKNIFLNIFRTYTVNKTVLEQEMMFKYHTVGYNEWLDIISNTYYRTPYLWWTITIFNNIVNPFEDINEGDVLKILRYEHVYIILDNMSYIGNL